jgi:hypothetical protein
MDKWAGPAPAVADCLEMTPKSAQTPHGYRLRPPSR